MTPEERANALVSRFESSPICTSDGMSKIIAKAIRAAVVQEREDALLRARANWAAWGGLPSEWKEDVETYCDRIVAEEREACAKIAESLLEPGLGKMQFEIAAEIRARGNNEPPAT